LPKVVGGCVEVKLVLRITYSNPNFEENWTATTDLELQSKILISWGYGWLAGWNKSSMNCVLQWKIEVRFVLLTFTACLSFLTWWVESKHFFKPRTKCSGLNNTHIWWTWAKSNMPIFWEPTASSLECRNRRQFVEMSYIARARRCTCFTLKCLCMWHVYIYVTLVKSGKSNNHLWLWKCICDKCPRFKGIYKLSVSTKFWTQMSRKNDS
jgi:hypothetical protein